MQDFKHCSPRTVSIIQNTAIAFLYVFSYWALDGLSFIYLSDKLNITPWNPPVAASIILLFMRPLTWSPLLLVASLSYQLIFEKPAASLSIMVMTSVGEAFIYTCAVWFLRTYVRIDRYLGSLRDVIIFACTIFGASALMGVSYILAYLSAGVLSAQEAPALIAQYWAGDCLGILSVAPFVLVNWSRFKRLSGHSRFSQESLLQTAFTLFLVPFTFWTEKNGIHMFYLFFIPLVWAAISGGLARVTWITLVIQGAVIFSCWGFKTEVQVTLKFLPFIVTVIACMGLILGAVIDERERVKLSNLKNDARLRAILDMAPDWMMIVDMQGCIVAANTNFKQIYGLDHFEAIITQPVRQLIPAFYPELSGESFLLLHDGSTLPIEISTSKVPVGDKFSSILTLRDISPRKQAEAQLRLRRAKTEQATRINLTGGLAAILAHELNQPLSAIMAYASACTNIIAAMDVPPARVMEQLEKVSVQTRRAGDIIRKLREFFQNSSIEAGKVGIADLINEALMLLEDEIMRAKIQIEVNIDKSLIGLIDRIQIEQVLINLIKNAIDALREDPNGPKIISLSANTSAQGMIEILVKDTGPGVAAEIADHLFSPFVTTRLSGMGLGLSISRSIVEAHNGRLWSGDSSGKGASMHFTIPLFEGNP